MIACGISHTLFIDPEGVVWASGCNDQGQLGIGSLIGRHKIIQTQEVPFAVQVSAAEHGNHSAILDHQGNLYMFGANHKSQTGCDEEQTRIASPTKVRDVPSIIMVSCGFRHTIALDINGCLWGAGENMYGQLSSEGAILKKFTQITYNTTDPMGKVINISCGLQHSICQSETGELWSVGYNVFGELGVGHNRNLNRFQKVPLEEDILVQSFHCGMHLSVVLDRDGGVWATGNGANGQLGSGNKEEKNRFTKMLNIPPMTHIVCGGYSIIMMDRNEKVYACGYNHDAQLGVGDDKYILSPQAVPDLPKISQGCISYGFSLVVDEEGGVWVSGNRYWQRGINVKRFVRVEGIWVNTRNEKRYFNTKRAH